MPRSVGVEEEFLLVSPGSAASVPVGGAVSEAADRTSDAQFEHEFKREQTELGTAPCVSLDDLGRQLRERRAHLAENAAAYGARLAALATSPVVGSVTSTASDRYELMGETFGHVARGQLTCGMHVHVDVHSPQEGVGVLDRIRPWLAVLTALSANSPFSLGQDTGYASYRTVAWGQWPTAGPTAAFGDVDTYDRVRAELVASGAALDDGMIYFDARLSAHYPTVEVRVADVIPYVDDAVVVAGLARAMVTTAAAQWSSGAAAPDVRTELLRAASWRAARWGMTGELLDPVTARPVRAWSLVDDLLEWARPGTDETGDEQLLVAGLEEIRSRGTGSTLQRDVLAGTGSLDAVVDAVVARTTA